MKNKIYSVLISLVLLPLIAAFVLGLTILSHLACHLITINFGIWTLIGLMGVVVFCITTKVIHEILTTPKPIPAKSTSVK